MRRSASIAVHRPGCRGRAPIYLFYCRSRHPPRRQGWKGTTPPRSRRVSPPADRRSPPSTPAVWFSRRSGAGSIPTCRRRERSGIRCGRSRGGARNGPEDLQGSHCGLGSAFRVVHRSAPGWSGLPLSGLEHQTQSLVDPGDLPNVNGRMPPPGVGSHDLDDGDLLRRPRWTSVEDQGRSTDHGSAGR